MGSAAFSPCRTWRYSLTRELSTADGAGTVTFVGLNPSTADETTADPTVRRCLRYASEWGFARLEVVNLYALCTSHPRELWRSSDPVGPENDAILALALGRSDLIVAAWGVYARPDRLAQVGRLFAGRPLYALGMTKRGAPRHPLYLRADAKPFAFTTLLRAPAPAACDGAAQPGALPAARS